jgi:arsenate reductase (thioredoxin)
MSTTTANKVFPEIQYTVDKFTTEFSRIPDERKAIIQQLTDFVSEGHRRNQRVLLNFICTHNSRRSHIAQIWAQTAAHYYGIRNVKTFSGGTEATAFNSRAVAAMRHVGFEIKLKEQGSNPVYEVRYSNDATPLTIFSKKYDDVFNPRKSFAAIMTCSHADENCPLVIGASARIALTYNDPKDFDGTPQESAKYLERVHEIGREIFYAFSKVK